MAALANSRKQGKTGALFLILCAVMFAAACSELPTESAGGPGYYRLVSAKGAPVPLAAGSSSLLSGDLVLRTNGTARYAIRGMFPTVVGAPTFNGNYSVSDGHVTMSLEGRTYATGMVSGDSLLLSVDYFDYSPTGYALSSFPAVFRRMEPDAVPVKSGTYVMTNDGTRTIDGVVGTDGRIQYDTIMFFDGVFYERSVGDATPLQGIKRGFLGTYRGNTSFMVLYELDDKSLTNTAPHSDSLFVKDGALIRRIWGINAVLDQRYEKR